MLRSRQVTARLFSYGWKYNAADMLQLRTLQKPSWRGKPRKVAIFTPLKESASRDKSSVMSHSRSPGCPAAWKKHLMKDDKRTEIDLHGNPLRTQLADERGVLVDDALQQLEYLQNFESGLCREGHPALPHIYLAHTRELRYRAVRSHGPARLQIKSDYDVASVIPFD